MIDPRLAFGALEGINKPIGPGIVSGMNVYNQMQDRQRQDQERMKMQSLGQFVGDQFAGGEPDYNAITSRVAEINPLKGIELDQNRLAAAERLKLAQLKNAPKPGLDPNFLKNAAADRFTSRNLLNTYLTAKDPTLKEEAKIQYDALRQKYATETKPNILGLNNPDNKVKQLEIPSLSEAMQSRREREIGIGMNQAKLSDQLRVGAIKDSEFITQSIKDYEQFAARDGFSLSQVNTLAKNLETAKRLADEGSVAGMHALNILTNKTLDPNSAVLLSEAQAFDEQDMISILKRIGASLVGIDPKTFNVQNVYDLAKDNISARSKNAQKLVLNKRNLINNELKARGSKRQIGLETISPYATNKGEKTPNNPLGIEMNK